MKRRSFFLLIILFFGQLLTTQIARTSSTGWEAVGTGIEYREFNLQDPNNVFVTRMDRSNPNVTLESSIAQGKLTSGKETVSGMADHYDQAINFWGQSWGSRNDVVVAINGSFYDTVTGVPEGGQIHSGWYAKRFDDMAGGSGIAWKLDGTAFIGECVYHRPERQFITFTPSGNIQLFDGINVPRESDELILYTPQYDVSTGTDNTGVEILVEMARPELILPTPAMAKGYVREIRVGQESTKIPFDHIVLSANGAASTTLLNNVSVGVEIGISQEIMAFEDDCSTPLSVDWTKTYASIGGSYYFLKDGIIQNFSDPGSTERNPRTAVCFNDTHIYFVVNDGRDAGNSVGMSIQELAIFCKDTLAATWGINQDGGGSSTMVVNGIVKNNPSDGTERQVANGMMMVVVEPIEQSTILATGEPVTTLNPTDVRLGPGSNYPVIASVSENTEGFIIQHFNNLDGVFAKGSFWWKVELGNVVGWVEEASLIGKGEPPSGFIVESRQGGQNYGNYTDSRMEDSTVKSTVAGATAAIGSREGKLKCAGPARTAIFSYTPSTSGLYEGFTTWAASSLNGEEIEHIISHDGGTTSVLIDQSVGAHRWNSFGQYFLSDNNTYFVTMTNENYCDPNSSDKVFRADAVMWELVTGDTPPSVSIVNPANGSAVSGTIMVTADASDDNGVAQVEFFVDSGSIGVDSNGTDGWSISWDTTTSGDGSRTVRVTATDTIGQTGSYSVLVTVDNVNDPPVASYDYACNLLTCNFDGSGSIDADGYIVSYDWDFGDGNFGSGVTPSHDYSITGDYTVLLTVTDDGGATGTDTQTVSVSDRVAESHVGNLNGSTETVGRKGWKATVVIIGHDGNHDLISDATVTGSWDGGNLGTSSCVTDATGSCEVTSRRLSNEVGKVTFAVVSVVYATYTYTPGENHDPNDATIIVFFIP